MQHKKNQNSNFGNWKEIREEREIWKNHTVQPIHRGLPVVGIYVYTLELVVNEFQ